MSEKIKTINKEEIGEMEIPNGGSVKSLEYEPYEDEDGYIPREGISGEAANKIVDFEESRMLFGNKTKRLKKMAEDESLRKAA